MNRPLNRMALRAFSTVALLIMITSKPANGQEWTRFSDIDYLYKSGTKDLASADQECKASHGALLKIQTQQEQNFISRLTGKKDVWIGAEKKTANFEWLDDGGHLAYNDWAKDEPGSGKAIILSSGGDWKTTETTAQQGVVCQKLATDYNTLRLDHTLRMVQASVDEGTEEADAANLKAKELEAKAIATEATAKEQHLSVQAFISNVFTSWVSPVRVTGQKIRNIELDFDISSAHLDRPWNLLSSLLLFIACYVLL